MKRLYFFLSMISAAASSSSVLAEAIEDNSFLLEEAYNQEAGVVQFIQTFQKDKSGEAFYSFSTELPAPNQTHQLSFTVPYNRLKDATTFTNGVGDTALNYRYQLLNHDVVAIAPRLSVLLPTGDTDKGFGSGVTGLQTNWAISVKASNFLVVHMNVGATYLPAVKHGLDKTKDLYGHNSALSVIWLAHENFNLLTEFVTSSIQEGSESQISVTSDTLINPGFRYAVNFNNAQLVLGASAPTPVLYSKGPASYLAYLSFEPKLW